MTEKQMSKRMKEIETERDKLKAESKEYEKYFQDKKLEERLKDHQTYIGKCYVSKDFQENQNNHIKAFKILEVLNPSNEDYARCIVLVDGYDRNCWNSYSIKNEVLPLWIPNKLILMYNNSDPKMIDMYKEISQEKFESLYTIYKGNLEDKVYV